MKIKAHGPDFVEIDYTPMIDMTFQLIAFFMILINFSDAEQDQRVQLPVQRPGQAAQQLRSDAPITIQMVRDGKIIMNGELLSDVNAMKPFLNNEKYVLRIRRAKRQGRHDHHPRPPRRQNGPGAADHQGLPGNRLREVHAARQVRGRLLSIVLIALTIANGTADQKTRPARQDSDRHDPHDRYRVPVAHVLLHDAARSRRPKAISTSRCRWPLRGPACPIRTNCRR